MEWICFLNLLVASLDEGPHTKEKSLDMQIHGWSFEIGVVDASTREALERNSGGNQMSFLGTYLIMCLLPGRESVPGYRGHVPGSGVTFARHSFPRENLTYLLP